MNGGLRLLTINMIGAEKFLSLLRRLVYSNAISQISHKECLTSRVCVVCIVKKKHPSIEHYTAKKFFISCT